ncbi:uncharacterized protein B0T15DRAFT_148839 [Chaetomium strumarium]|uniref:Uncharacterized protein n=1 Tax=Chaetomium strumarium TaxID=1170767 RepID=A0AAJ0GVB0_9PEZI|nr:hypothetical protein B0T15DRAFT_148839 [Chaetomium strumarium]
MRGSLPRRLRSPRLPVPVLRCAFSSAALAHPIPESTPEAEPSKPPTQQQQQSPPVNQNAASPDSETTTTTAHTTSPPINPPLIYPSAPSPHHTDLPTFLAYAERTNLDPSSTVYVGTHFEYTVSDTLARFGLHLRRVGGVSDCGIDLLGTWSVPSYPRRARPLRVLAQCKAVQRPGPHLVRELEGAFVGAPAGWRGPVGVVGLLVTEKPATKGIRDALGRSTWPMGFVACSREGRVQQFLWNQRAREEGLEELGVTARHVNGDGEGEPETELVLTWRGKTLPFGSRGETGS